MSTEDLHEVVTCEAGVEAEAEAGPVGPCKGRLGDLELEARGELIGWLEKGGRARACTGRTKTTKGEEGRERPR